jgi:hypothetical protein
MPEPLLIRCPTCNHALQLPEEFLGKIVTCLECRTPFDAPVRDGETLTAPVTRAKPSRVPARLFIPMFGLLLFGFLGVFVNGYLWWWFHTDPKAAATFAEANFQFMMTMEPPKPSDDKKLDKDEAKKLAEQFAEQQQRAAKEAASQVSVAGMKRIRIVFLVMSLGVLAGGFSFAMRSSYPYCFVACVLSAVNTPDLGCCFFGIVIGVWGAIVLVSDEGRAYFGRSTSGPAIR